MSENDANHNATEPHRPISAQAQRALTEAQERRRHQQRVDAAAAKEIGGRNGPEPTRFGDWEKAGIVSDF